MATQQSSGRIHVSFKQALGMLGPYVKTRVMEQVKAVALIITYLIAFQTLVLGIPLAEAVVIAVGLSLVVAGLTFFMEGLLLGLMPLGEVCGVKLPQKSKLPVILIFAFILGMGATFAEPAISVLQAAGSSVMAWKAPLLFLMLNKQSSTLVLAVGVGVGIAVMFGMLRFLYNWSLKPFIYILVSLLTVLTLYCFMNPNLNYVLGLAWDCGAVTTGPVTVPLVLALGIGICRVVGSADSGAAGFGVVTLASAFPILAVIGLGLSLVGAVPQPMKEQDFFSPQYREQVQGMFNSREEMYAYVFKNTGAKTQAGVFDGEEAMLDYLKEVKASTKLETTIFGKKGGLGDWALERGTPAQRLAVFGSEEAVKEASLEKAQRGATPLDVADVSSRNGILALRAILPLSAFLMLVLVFILREKLPKADEVMLGLLFAVFGMGLFNVGIELGLAKMGAQVGGKVPAAFKSIELTEEHKAITGFDPAVVQTAVTEKGEKKQFFFNKTEDQYEPLPYHKDGYDESTRTYNYTPLKGPLFGTIGGIIVILIFAFVMGYGATLAEPALNALGLTVEELTVGTFKKSLLMQTVALGVGVGIALGVAKIIWDIPLTYMLLPPYMVLMLVTRMSTEEFTNIGWDSAGVTTGPITVPLVLAMGLGIGGQVGVVEGFGILSMASVCPILAVLLVGLSVTKKRKAQLEKEQAAAAEAAAAQMGVAS